MYAMRTGLRENREDEEETEDEWNPYADILKKKQ